VRTSMREISRLSDPHARQHRGTRHRRTRLRRGTGFPRIATGEPGTHVGPEVDGNDPYRHGQSAEERRDIELVVIVIVVVAHEAHGV
jgi:hypothetical protein